VFPAFREAFVKVKGIGVPPEASVHGSTATENATGHDGVVSASDTVRVNPDLVVKTGNIEAGEVSSNEPVGLHGATVATR